MVLERLISSFEDVPVEEMNYQDVFMIDILTRDNFSALQKYSVPLSLSFDYKNKGVKGLARALEGAFFGLDICRKLDWMEKNRRFLNEEEDINQYNDCYDEFAYFYTYYDKEERKDAFNGLKMIMSSWGFLKQYEEFMDAISEDKEVLVSLAWKSYERKKIKSCNE